eukprot:TRINITY_DN407_c0_g1_i1.p1 TRINITY_DN407_c0_g1~~TRINITY_DN407_c0_g1_i1.p1  ORF type:complete len:757 (-),score=185.82 TRINITY_DN407_c0_g1_i1:34-2304(-)
MTEKDKAATPMDTSSQQEKRLDAEDRPAVENNNIPSNDNNIIVKDNNNKSADAKASKKSGKKRARDESDTLKLEERESKRAKKKAIEQKLKELRQMETQLQKVKAIRDKKGTPKKSASAAKPKRAAKRAPRKKVTPVPRKRGSDSSSSDSDPARARKRSLRKRNKNKASSRPLQSIDSLPYAIKQCYLLLKKIQEQKFSWPFNSPVDAEALGLPDYHKVIKHPMDLGTISNQLRQQYYANEEEFAEDVQLVWSNALLYNQPGSDIVYMTNTLRDFWEKKYAALREKLENRRALALTNKLNSLVNSVADMQKRVSDYGRSTPQAKASSRRSGGRRNVNKRMTLKEKTHLSDAINTLPTEHLGEVVKIIRKSMPDLVETEEEMEIDIDSLNTPTLRELERYVQSVTKPKNSLVNSATEAQRKLEQLTKQLLEVNKQAELLKKKGGLPESPSKPEPSVWGRSSSDGSDSESKNSSSASGSSASDTSDTSDSDDMSLTNVSKSSRAPKPVPKVGSTKKSSPIKPSESAVPKKDLESTASVATEHNEAAEAKTQEPAEKPTETDKPKEAVIPEPVPAVIPNVKVSGSVEITNPDAWNDLAEDKDSSVDSTETGGAEAAVDKTWSDFQNRKKQNKQKEKLRAEKEELRRQELAKLEESRKKEEERKRKELEEMGKKKKEEALQAELEAQKERERRRAAAKRAREQASEQNILADESIYASMSSMQVDAQAPSILQMFQNDIALPEGENSGGSVLDLESNGNK